MAQKMAQLYTKTKKNLCEFVLQKRTFFYIVAQNLYKIFQLAQYSTSTEIQKKTNHRANKKYS